MASVQTNSHDGRYLKLTVVEESTDITSNTSTVRWTLESIGGNSNYYTIYNCSVVVNGTTVYNAGTVAWNSYKFPAKKGSETGTISVTHKNDGTADPISFTLHGKVYASGDDNKSSTLSLSTIPRYFTNTPTLEVISKTETSVTIKWTTSENASRSQYKINSGNWVDVETNINKSTGTMTITGLSAGQTYTIYGDFMRYDSGLWCQTKPSISVTTYDYPYVRSAPNFTIGNTLTIGIYNPLGRSCAIYIVGADNTQRGGDTITGTSISGYTGSGFVDWLYSTIPNSNSGSYKVRLVCSAVSRDTTVNGGTYYTNTANCSPSFSTFNVKDNNSSVVAVTGSDQVFVKSKSTLYVTIPSANKMTTQKSATPSSYGLSCDTLSQSANYSSNDVNVNMGTIVNSGTLRVNVRAYDSRSNSALAYKDITVYDYAKPVLNVSATRLNNFENETTIQISGTYTRLTIGGTDKNTITNVKYRYRETGGTWGSWTNLTTTVNAGRFSCSDVILSLDNTKSFEFEVQATDNLDNNTKLASVNIGQAIFFISSNNKACYINGQEILMYDVIDTW